MFEQTRFVQVADLRLHRNGGDPHYANSQCIIDGCSRVTITIVPKIDEPGMGAVVRDATGTYLHTGGTFAAHWRRVGGERGKDLRRWNQLADAVELVRLGIGPDYYVDGDLPAERQPSPELLRDIDRAMAHGAPAVVDLVKKVDRNARGWGIEHGRHLERQSASS